MVVLRGLLFGHAFTFFCVVLARVLSLMILSLKQKAGHDLGSASQARYKPVKAGPVRDAVGPYRGLKEAQHSRTEKI